MFVDVTWANKLLLEAVAQLGTMALAFWMMAHHNLSIVLWGLDLATLSLTFTTLLQ